MFLIVKYKKLHFSTAVIKMYKKDILLIINTTSSIDKNTNHINKTIILLKQKIIVSVIKFKFFLNGFIYLIPVQA